MSDRDIVIRHSAEIEVILDQLGAEGKGLGQKAISIKHLFTYEINQKLKSICYVRNVSDHLLVLNWDRLFLFISNFN